MWERLQTKFADVDPMVSTSAVPPIQISPTIAQGKRGPVGLSPRQNFSRVNTGAPPTPDAGAMAQKSLMPDKVASEGKMSSMVQHPTLQDMMKAAMAGAASQVSITKAARLQKTAEETCSQCKKEPCDCKKTASVSTEEVMKLASAIGFISDTLRKQANEIGPGEGPGTTGVMESNVKGTTPGPGAQGQASSKNIPPMTPPMDGTAMHTTINEQVKGTQKMAQTKAAFLDVALAGALGGHKAPEGEEVEGALRGAGGYAVGAIPGALLGGAGGALIGGGLGAIGGPSVAIPLAALGLHTGAAAGGLYGGYKGYKALTSKYDKKGKKEASAPLSAIRKVASASNAPISAIRKLAEEGPGSGPGALQVSAAGEAGGAPAGGMPEGRTSLIASNEAAINYTRGQAKAPEKADMRAYHTEPMHSMEHDKTLREAFVHTSEAGSKFASASDQAVRNAAGRALLEKLAEAAAQGN